MKRLCILFLLLMLLSGQAFAQEEIDVRPVEEALPESASELMGKTSVGDHTDLWSGLKEILHKALGKVTLCDSLRLCALLLCVILLCSVTGSFSERFSGNCIAMVGAIGMTAVFAGSFHSMLELAVDALENMTDYSTCMLPVLATATAMSGSPTASAALYGGTILFSQLLMRLIRHFIVPLVYFYLLVAAAEAALQTDMLAEIRAFFGWLAEKSLRIVLYVFLGFMSVTGVISGATDAAAVKATKAAVSGMIPVVGGMISDASETLLASAGILRNSIGVFGMLAIVATCLLPFLRVGVHYLLLKMTAAVSGTIGQKPHVALMKHFSSAMGYLLAMCGSCALMLLISFVCFIKAVIA